MIDNTREFVYGTKCRYCGFKNTWYFGHSDSIDVNSFLESILEKRQFGTNNYCDRCKSVMVCDITFYGNKEDYINFKADKK